jgi:hypothetical protein
MVNKKKAGIGVLKDFIMVKMKGYVVNHPGLWSGACERSQAPG